MNTKTNSNEQGQALVLIVLAMVALLGFTALAVDGGMVYADRRFAQNAADASSLAGAAAVALYLENSEVFYTNWDCNDPLISAAQNANDGAKAAAISRAADNGFTIERDVPINGVRTSCGTLDKIGWLEKYIDITTTISITTHTSFAHFVYKGPLANQVVAVARVEPPRPWAYGQAIVALNQAACSGNKYGVIFRGSSVSTITGGGVFSNGCLRGDGNKFTVNVNNGNVNYVGETSGTMSNINPAPEQAPYPIPRSSYGIPTPNCDGLTNYGSATSGGEIYEGVYTKITLNNGSLHFNPGLYCVTGGPDAIKFTGGQVTGEGVTIYVTQGSVSISGNVEPVDLAAPLRGSKPPHAIEGLLIYLAEGNTSEVNMKGNSNTKYYGTIYAPDGDIVLTGANNTSPTFNTQLIGNNVDVGGNVDLQIVFNDYHNALIHASMQLFR